MIKIPLIKPKAKPMDQSTVDKIVEMSNHPKWIEYLNKLKDVSRETTDPEGAKYH